MKSILARKVYICIACSLLISGSGNYSKAGKSSGQHAVFNTSVLETGDVILRESNGLLAGVFKSFSLEEKKYSHAGFILKEKSNYYVCHFIDASSGGFTKESVIDFTSPDQCRSFAVYRPAYSPKQKQCITACINDPANKQLHFDDRFELKSDSSMYCTEWIYKCLMKAGFHVPVTKLDAVEYIAPDNLYINNFTLKILRIDYASEI
jgi:hypothetical protein